MGAVYEGMPIGRNDFSLASVFSFHPGKNDNDRGRWSINRSLKKLKEKAVSLRSHGIFEKKKKTKTSPRLVL